MEDLLLNLIETNAGYYIAGSIAALYLILKHGKGLIQAVVGFTKTKKDDKASEIVYDVLEKTEPSLKKIVDKVKEEKTKRAKK